MPRTPSSEFAGPEPLLARFMVWVMGAAALGLTACAPGAPDGISKPTLDNAVNNAIGDPNTCVLIAKPGSATPVYQFGSHAACDRSLPACDRAGTRTAAEVLTSEAQAPAPLAASCPSSPGGDRSVGWTAGRVSDRGLIYVAVMEGPSAPPGRVVGEKVLHAFRLAGL